MSWRKKRNQTYTLRSSHQPCYSLQVIMILSRNLAEGNDEILSFQSLQFRWERRQAKSESSQTNLEETSLTAISAGLLGNTPATLANSLLLPCSFSSSSSTSIAPFPFTFPSLGSSPLGNPLSSKLPISSITPLRSFRSLLIWERAVRIEATSRSERGKPSGSIKEVAIVTSFYLHQSRVQMPSIRLRRDTRGIGQKMEAKLTVRKTSK